MKDLYENLEFRFAPPTLVWCSSCWAAHEPNPHLDAPVNDTERHSKKQTYLSSFLRQNRFNEANEILVKASKAVGLAKMYSRHI